MTPIEFAAERTALRLRLNSRWRTLGGPAQGIQTRIEESYRCYCPVLFQRRSCDALIPTLAHKLIEHPLQRRHAILSVTRRGFRQPQPLSSLLGSTKFEMTDASSTVRLVCTYWSHQAPFFA